MRVTRLTAAALIAASLTCPRFALGQDRLARRFTALGDILLGSVRSLAQDSVGFVWIGTVGGLLRWDGQELRRWAPEQIDSWANYQAVCPDGTHYVVEEGGTLFEITATGARAVPVPAADAAAPVRNVRCDRDSRVWVAVGASVWRRDAGGPWLEAAPGAFAGLAPFLLQGPANSGVWLRTAQTLWRLDAGGTARRIVEAPFPQAVAIDEAGDTLLLTRNDGLFRLRAGPARLTRLVPALGRGIDLQRRGTTVWAAFDRYLVAIRPGEPPEVLGSDAIPEGGGPLLVDREASLWVATFSGLVQFPEPETLYWNDRHGLPSAHTRYVARSGNRVWTSTWQGLGYIEERAGRRAAHTMPADWLTQMRLHVDTRGVLWAVTLGGLREIADGRTASLRPFPFFHWDVEPAPGGGVWLAASDGLFAAPAGSGAVRPVAGSPFAAGTSVRQILRTRLGHLWLAGDERICGSTHPAVQPQDATWRCDSIPGAVEITDLVELPSGALWASSSRRGVWRRREGRWEPHPANATLASLSVFGLRPSREDGVWVLGLTTPVRVREAAGAPLGWDVLETVGAWQGLSAMAGDVVEDPDGTLWMTTSLGLARVAAAARHSAPTAPTVVLVAAAIDGAAVTDSARVRLRHRHNRLDLRFAALSLRDPARLRYQVRLAPREEWTGHTGQPSFSWIDLPAGRYRAEVRASLDGATWSASPAGFEVTVLGPWFRQPWAVALAVLAVGAVAYAAHRARVAVLLRLERQRTQIALDLHDEMGSGLGSIGILSGVLGDEQLEADERRRLAAKIAEVAAELGASLSDIVWSLRPVAATLGDVGARLAEHGARLFASGPTRFTTRLPDAWPAAPLDPAVSRGTLLIGLEALYNAARHAGARQVSLAFAPESGGWRLDIEDDGRGLPGPEENGGLGLASMRRRAEQMGGRIEWADVPGGGTRVSLHIVMRGGV